MATITFELGKLKQDKTRRVSIIISHKGQRKRVSTNIIIPEESISRSGKLPNQVQKVIDNKYNTPPILDTHIWSIK